jgi:hypothetical protein
MKTQYGSYNVWQDSNGLLALETEIEGCYQLPKHMNRAELSATIVLAADALLFKVDNEEQTVLYGDGVDIQKVFGWTIEVEFKDAAKWNEGTVRIGAIY